MTTNDRSPLFVVVVAGWWLMADTHDETRQQRWQHNKITTTTTIQAVSIRFNPCWCQLSVYYVVIIVWFVSCKKLAPRLLSCHSYIALLFSSLSWWGRWGSQRRWNTNSNVENNNNNYKDVDVDDEGNENDKGSSSSSSTATIQSHHRRALAWRYIL